MSLKFKKKCCIKFDDGYFKKYLSKLRDLSFKIQYKTKFLFEYTICPLKKKNLKNRKKLSLKKRTLKMVESPWKCIQENETFNGVSDLETILKNKHFKRLGWKKKLLFLKHV